MADRFRVGVVGAGSVAAAHLDAAASCPDVEVAAICDVRLDAAEQLAARCGARAYPGHQEMYAGARLDGVVVAAPHALHAPITVAAADAGLHVLVEKPMATTVVDCQRMIDACAERGVRLAVGHVMHFLPSVRRARDVLLSGALGSPVVVTGRRTARYEPGSRPEWFFDPVLAGGGIVMNVGTHSIDRTQWLTDAPVHSVVGHVHRPPGVGVETEAVALLKLDNGVRASLAVTGTSLPFRDDTEVVCEGGALRMSRSEGLWTYRNDEAAQLLAPGGDEVATGFAEQLADFVACCREDRPPAVDGAYGLSVVATVLAWYESSARSERVAVTREGNGTTAVAPEGNGTASVTREPPRR